MNANRTFQWILDRIRNAEPAPAPPQAPLPAPPQAPDPAGMIASRAISIGNQWMLIATDGYCIQITSTVERSKNHLTEIALINYRQLLEEAGQLWAKWLIKSAPPEYVAWATATGKQKLRRQLYQAWQELLSECDPRVVAVQRAMTASCGKCMEPGLAYHIDYGNPDLKHHAARLYVMRYGGLPDNWMDTLSPTGKKYPALTKTLMNLPYGLSGSILDKIAQTQLPTALKDRVQLIAAVYASQTLANRIATQPATHIKAAVAQFRCEMARVNRRPQPSPHMLAMPSTKDVLAAIQYMRDYERAHPQPKGSNANSIMKRAIEWHRTLAAAAQHQAQPNPAQPVPVRLAPQTTWAQQAKAMGGFPGEDTPTKRSACNLESIQGFRRLTTVGDMIAESLAMGHCIATHWSYAIRDDGFHEFYHVEYDSTSASLEWDPDHRCVVQCYGPNNTSNAATRWAQKQIRKVHAQIPAATAEKCAEKERGANAVRLNPDRHAPRTQAPSPQWSAICHKETDTDAEEW